MNQQDFEKLIKKDEYQVFLFESPCSLPLSFAKHHWLVISKKGKISRYEVLFQSNQCKTSFGHLHLNYLKPATGLNIILGVPAIRWKSKLLSSIQGDENSTAKKMINIIEGALKKYPVNYKYSFFGPNSNTFIQWVINKSPKSNFKLPEFSVGKNYKK